MVQYIDKSSLVAEIEKELNTTKKYSTEYVNGKKYALKKVLSFLNTLEVKDPYEQCVQYDSIKAGIQAHAETYSFNIESELFHQLTKEQQELWRKEIEQACISGGDAGYSLAKDTRYKENLEVKEVDLDGEIALWANAIPEIRLDDVERLATYFFELGLKAQSKDMIEALRTEYEKGRADVIADTLSWLANVWPQYCSNPNIIDAYKEGVVKE